VAEFKRSMGAAAACLRLSADPEQLEAIEFSAPEANPILFDAMVPEILRLENRKAETISCPRVIQSTFETVELSTKDYLMLRSIRPFRVSGEWIENTDSLIRLVEGSPAAFWESDGF
jgi:hypothetical protein